LKVHAVVVHHRDRTLLKRCLSSLSRSVDVELQVVLVLNACDEELPGIVEASDQIHVVALESEAGFSAANNRGVKWAREHLGPPDAYYFVNNDTESEGDVLSLLARVLNEDPEVAVVGPRLMIAWAPDHLNSLGLNVTEDGWGWDEGIGIAAEDYGPLPPRREVLAVTGSALLITNSAFERVGGWTELYDYYFEDIDLCLKVRRCGWKIVNEPAAVVLHHVSATTAVDSEWKRSLFYRNRLLVTFLHWPWPLMLRKVLTAAVIDEVLAQPWSETALQRRAIGSAVRKLPKAMWRRARVPGKRRDWGELLYPPGSVPAISLPEPESRSQTAVRPSAREEGWRAIVSTVGDRVRAFSPSANHDRRVAVVGCAPLPWEEARMNFAPGARTWQLVRALADDGHFVLAVCGRIPGAYDGDGRGPAVCERDGALVVWLSYEELFNGDALTGLLDALSPECLVGSSVWPSARAVEVSETRPVWVDLFGDPMGEAQARAAVYDSGHLVYHKEMLAALLEGGDAFSVVSHRQRLAALGQLGMSGRLNQETAGRELVYVVPCSLPEDGTGPWPDPSPNPATAIDEDAFVVLWGGSYNTWCDIATLVGGLERAMAQNPAIRLVSTGGEIVGHDDRSYRSFVHAVAESRYAHRFHNQGTVTTGHAIAWIRRADLGVVTERRLVERELGSSGRMLTWLGLGLPIVCTTQSEVGSRLVDERIAFGYRVGDPDDLARVILEAARDRDRLRAMAVQAREWAVKRWSVEHTTAPVREWVRTATRAPDRETANSPAVVDVGRRLELIEAERDALLERAEVLETDFHQVRSRLGSIHQSVMWRCWVVLRSLRSAVTFPIERLRKKD
jgi:GT2 family glycosyltransferase/glycosyltransferase involved in cell wall biosynthesis